MIFAIVVCDDNGICTRLWVFKSTHTHTHTYTREREKFEEDFFYLKIISRPLSIFHRSSSNVQNEIIIIIIILDNNYFLSKRNCLETSISIILRENQSWYTRLRFSSSQNLSFDPLKILHRKWIFLGYFANPFIVVHPGIYVVFSIFRDECFNSVK